MDNSVKNSKDPIRKSNPDGEALFKNLNELKRKLTDSKKTIMAHPFAGLRKPNVKMPKNTLSIGGKLNEKTSI